MSKNVKLNSNDYLGVSTIQIPTTDGMFASFKDVDEIVGGADTAVEDMFLTAEFTEYANDRVKELKGSPFYGMKALLSVSLPNVEAITGEDNFMNCTNLKNLNLPRLKSLSGNYTFQDCTSLESMHLDCLESVSGNAHFKGCTALKNVNLPKLKSGAISFWNCTGLEIVDIGREVTEEELPNTGLCPDFENCKNLKTIILRYAKVVGVNNAMYFRGTPFVSGGTGGTVYVPQALIEQYQQAVIWSDMYTAGTCHFVAIEGSEYE